MLLKADQRRVTRARLLLVASLTTIGLSATSATAWAGIWTPIDSGLGAGAPDIIRSIDYQSNDRFWYVTSSGKFGYREGGVFKLGAGSTAGVSFTDVAFQPAPGTIGIAVGTNGSVWRSTDSGKTWTKVTITTQDADCGEYRNPLSSTSNPGVIRAVAWGPDNTVWIGGDKATLQRSQNGGAIFTEINKTTVPDPPGSRVLAERSAPGTLCAWLNACTTLAVRARARSGPDRRSCVGRAAGGGLVSPTCSSPAKDRSPAAYNGAPPTICCTTRSSRSGAP